MRKSLFRSLFVNLIVAQFVAFIIGWTASLVLGLLGFEFFSQSFDELAISRSSRMIADSIQLETNGDYIIAPNADLALEASTNSGFKYAAFKCIDKRCSNISVALGSSQELTKFLLSAIRINSSHTHFSLYGDISPKDKGYMGPKPTKYGIFYIAVYGVRFRFIDIFISLYEEFQDSFIYLFSGLILTILSLIFALRRGLKSLVLISDELTQIDFNQRDYTLFNRDVASELLPVIEAINKSLSKLNQWSQRQRLFTANAAHELRTPLAIMRARLENSKGSILKTDLLSDTQHLTALVEQMLVSSRIFVGQLHLDEKIKVGEVVADVVKNILPLAIDNDKDIKFDRFGVDASIKANKSALTSVFMNLIDNALRYEPKGSCLVVQVIDGDNVKIIDHGVGIGDADKDLIFDPFWKADQSLKGAGLGLAISKDILDFHNAVIHVEDTEGGGSTFIIQFFRD